eukprot:TRINITY_DN64_c0_g1_i1.p2 TRINITY_DN64_c0_g1~~TRINITY_DN64_c0_g1_i1.p2  ORF type:complete len:87 (-),score=32.81 TRINITY_DN64_c0_g1_i1:50-310(-)
MKYRRYGLFLDDLLNESEPIVAEAIRRLPHELQEARQARVSRAIDCTHHNSYLPEDMWTKPHEDKPYLRPIMDEVLAEFKEKDEWK